jgi:putative ABC transport system ATP-binding protein
MEPTLFGFIWKYSRRQQTGLLLFTLAVFPLVYASLELPKMIINDAIGAAVNEIDVFGYELTQMQYLLLLCFLFLIVVLASGLMKMRLNTMKGVLAERLLRRLRYTLISRMMRFPASYFRTTSQGEMVSVVTSESEPMGGLMGDAVAQPVFQAGQMLTIVAFLFAQSVWFGLASIALIPVQAYVIPILQRQINLLNKTRIQEVRHLAAEIGETAAGAADLRENGGWRYRQAQISDRLGRLFNIRFQIYQKKFFMKFLNNFIGQLTPFLFYSAGGVLAIRGEITVGALVAALAAYKDLSSPWKELLTYYNQVQDMSLRWQIVTERFAPPGMVRAELFDGEPADWPHVRGDIVIDNVTVRDHDGNTLLEDFSLTIPHGARVAVKSIRPSERAALGQLLTREVLPARGTVTLAGLPLNEMHQSVIAARVGYAHSKPTIFNGTIGDNLLMPLRIAPVDEVLRDQKWHESDTSGNRPDPLNVNWTNAGLAGLTDGKEVRDWWFQLVQAIGLEPSMFHRILNATIEAEKHPNLIQEIVALRDQVDAALREKGLDIHVHRFHPDRFNPTIPLGGNLLYASPAKPISAQTLAQQTLFMDMLDSLGILSEVEDVSRSILETLRQTFGRDNTDHPLFKRLGLDTDQYLRMMDLLEKRQQYGGISLTSQENALLITAPFVMTAEQLGSAFPETLKARILAIRQSHGQALRDTMQGRMILVDPANYLPRLSVLDNLLFGRIAMMAGSHREAIVEVISSIVEQAGLRPRISALVYDVNTGLSGANISTTIQERIAFSRAAIKRPDILIMDTVLATHDADSRAKAREKLRVLLPDSTMIFMEDGFNNPENYDLYVEINDGRIDGIERTDDGDGQSASADLRRKLATIGDLPIFARLSSRNQRLLAFSAQWYGVDKGEMVFDIGQRADAVYLCVKGMAELRFEGHRAGDAAISLVEPGRLIGDLSVIMNEDRMLQLVTLEDSVFLRIGSEEYRAVIESDASVAISLLQTVAGYLSSAAGVLQEVRQTPEGRAAVSRLREHAEGDGSNVDGHDTADDTGADTVSEQTTNNKAPDTDAT